MKRLLIIAAIVAMAASCQKTTINAVVENPIGFSSEVGKQVKAIADGTAYSEDQPFGVYSYGYRVDANGARIQNQTASEPMRNVEVLFDRENNVWKSNPKHGSYYWPNDPLTRLDFYAYTPYIQSTDVVNPISPTKANVPHMVMSVEDLDHTEAAGLTFEGYEHTNMYVDFMEADKVEGATFGDQGGNLSENANKVPVSFNHKMTQIIFKVTTVSGYPGVNFKVKKISLKGIKNVANYSSKEADPWVESGSNTSEYDDPNQPGYVIFPADEANGAIIRDGNAKENGVESHITLTNATADANPLASMLTTGVTMIPQTMETNVQAFEIVYDVWGTGVATEEVTKLVYFRPDAQTVVNWEPNKRLTYVVKIGLNEIIFDTPNVKNWTDDDGEEHTVTPQ